MQTYHNANYKGVRFPLVFKSKEMDKYGVMTFNEAAGILRTMSGTMKTAPEAGITPRETEKMIQILEGESNE